MKHIKIFLFLVITSLPLHSEQNKLIENYFLNIYENEKLKFEDCLKIENLKPKEQTQKKCKISTLGNDASYLLFGKKFFKEGGYKPLFKPKIIYPTKSQRLGAEGRAIAEFDISEEGRVINPKIIEGKCGNPRSPYTKFKNCKDFDAAALRAVKQMVYEPEKLEGKNIVVKNVLHSFTFIMEDDELTVRNRKSRAYNNALKAISKKNFEEAINIAESNLEFDYIFMNQIANAKYLQGNYLEAREWLNKFNDELLNDQREIPEDMIVSSFMRLISSLFNLGEYEELINLEPEFNNYFKERKKYNELLALTNFYFGVSYINTGDIYKGAYYLGLAAKNSNSKAQLNYINNTIDQISSYLSIQTI